jgi:hypothetical protein
MVIHWIQDRGPEWRKGLAINATGMLVTLGILGVMTVVKFREGGWITLSVTGGFVLLCVLVRRHYRDVLKHLRDLNQILGDLPLPDVAVPPEKRPEAPTAVLMVSGYNGDRNPFHPRDPTLFSGTF